MSFKDILSFTTQKYEKLLSIMELSKKQEEAIKNEDPELLDSFIISRQKLIEEIERLDDRFEKEYQALSCKYNLPGRFNPAEQSYMSGIVNNSNINAPVEIKAITELKEKIPLIIALVNDISVIDRQNIKEALKLKDKLSGKIRQLNAGKNAVSAYKPQQPYTPSYFIDNKK